MSLRYNLAKKALASAGYKSLYGMDADAIRAQMEPFNKKRGFKVPRDGRCEYLDISVMEGRYHCLGMQKNKDRAKKAILYLYGGGFVLGPDDSDLTSAMDYGKDCGTDVWFPYYPLCLESPVTESVEMVFETYEKMVAYYGAENIIVLGFFSGAMLALEICLHNNALGRAVRMPGRVIAVSPLCCPDSDEMYERMLDLSDKDIMMDAHYLKTVRGMMKAGSNVPEYMLCPLKGDFSDLPHTDLWYGSDEVLCAASPSFEEAFKAAGVSYTINIGRDMCHCYPSVTFFPEGKQAREKICADIRS